MAVGTDTLKRTPLFDRHVAAGAKLVPFAGWEMPVQYTGIKPEHLAVRERVGIFDVSHMGEIETTGPDAEAFLQRILSNDVTKIAEHGAQYSVLTNEQGGVLDDLFTYRLDRDRFLTVTNASNHEKDLNWFLKHAQGFDVTIHDRLHDYAMLAVQGPEARALVAELADGELPKRFRTTTLTVAGAPGVLVCGTGYTGEDGVELLVAPQHATKIWDAVVAAGATPAGLGARDTLRLEAGMPLYGQELSRTISPFEAGLGRVVKFDKEGDFVGRAALEAASANPRRKLVGLRLTGRGIARTGYPVYLPAAEAAVGEVTSGTSSPTLGYSIAMAYLPVEHAEVGTAVAVGIRNDRVAAEVIALPFYRRGT